MTVSILISFLETVFLQEQSLGEVFITCILGYRPESSLLGEVMAGRGLISMIEVIIIVYISCTYAGVFDGTGMLKEPLYVIPLCYLIIKKIWYSIYVKRK